MGSGIPSLPSADGVRGTGFEVQASWARCNWTYFRSTRINLTAVTTLSTKSLFFTPQKVHFLLFSDIAVVSELLMSSLLMMFLNQI